MIEKIISFLLGLSNPLLMHLYTKIFSIDAKLKEKVNSSFFIPSHEHITKIIFKTITAENKEMIRKHVSSIKFILDSDNARYYVPEEIVFQLDRLEVLLFHESADFNELNNTFERFCNAYFIEFNAYKDSQFLLKYSIVPNHKDKIKKLRRDGFSMLLLVILNSLAFVFSLSFTVISYIRLLSIMLNT